MKTSLSPLDIRCEVLLHALEHSEPCFTFDDVAKLERLQSWPPQTINRTLRHLVTHRRVRYDEHLRIVAAEEGP